MPAAPTWNHKYTIRWTSENGELCIVHLSGLNASGAVVELLADETPIQISTPNSEERKDTPIRGKEAILRIVIRDTDTIGLATFLGADNEWKLDYYKADLSITNWQGFLVQDEHTRQMQDPPYVLELRAVDGLGWLKDKALIKPDGSEYVELNFILDYAGDILWQLNPYLKLVTHVNIFHIAMEDRTVDPNRDPWAQAKVHCRTFQNDDASFEDQYTVLEKILTSWGCELFQWYGAWHIVDSWDRLRGLTSYTTYGYDLDHPTNAHIRINEGGEIDKEFLCKIAPHASLLFSGPVHPSQEDQLIGLKFANKSVRLTYKYQIPVDLVNNQLLRRLGSLIAPLSGVGYAAYQLVGWSQYSGTLAGAGIFPVSAVNAYIKTETNTFGIETNRYYVVEHDPATTAYPMDNFIKNDNNDFWVEAGDVLSVSVETRLKNDQDDTPSAYNCLLVAILTEGTSGSSLSHWYTLNQSGEWLQNGQNLARIILGKDAREWETVAPDDQFSVPVSGQVYVWLGTDGVDDGNEAHFRNLTITYIPRIRGSLTPVKGDYNLIAQNQEYKQKQELEISISDANHRIFKGALYRFTNVPTPHYTLAQPSWYRNGITETRRFGEIQALKRFWHTYRAMQKIEGTFSGLIFFESTELPIGLMTLFDPEYLGEAKKYMLTNIDENHKTAEWKGTMIEAGNEADASITIDTNSFNYIFE